MTRLKFRCYIYGKDWDWEAICTDLDISVQGDSLKMQNHYSMEPLLVSLKCWRESQRLTESVC